MTPKPPHSNAEVFVDEMMARYTILRRVEKQRRKEAENFLTSIGLGEGAAFNRSRLLIDNENSHVGEGEACIVFKADDSVALMHEGRWQVGILE